MITEASKSLCEVKGGQYKLICIPVCHVGVSCGLMFDILDSQASDHELKFWWDMT